MSTEKISIIVPVYNSSRYLNKCIDSILKQDYENIELLLIDDGSTDNSLDICNSYSFDQRVTVIHKNNGGVNSARAIGFDLSTGDYITFADADDAIEKQTYKLVMQCFGLHNVDMVAFRAKNEYGLMIDTDGSFEFDELDKTIIQKADIYDNFLERVKFGTTLWNKVWKKKCLEDVAFRADIHLCEDAVYVWDSLKNVKSILVLEASLYHYRIGLSNATHASSLERYKTSITAWDYIKTEAIRKEISAATGISKGRIRWLLKTAKCIAENKYTNRKKEYDGIVNKLKEESDCFHLLPLEEKVETALLLRSYYNAFELFITIESIAKKTFIKLKTFF